MAWVNLAEDILAEFAERAEPGITGYELNAESLRAIGGIQNRDPATAKRHNAVWWAQHGHEQNRKRREQYDRAARQARWVAYKSSHLANIRAHNKHTNERRKADPTYKAADAARKRASRARVV